MKPVPFVIVCAAALACGIGNSHAVLLSNGNLDQTYQQEIVGGFFLPKPLNWINQGTRAITGPYEDEMSSESWAGPAPTPVTTDGNPGGAAPGGDAAVFFKAFSGNAANGAATGHLYQDNPANPGWSYTLVGWAGAEANYLASETVFALEFLDSGGSVISSFETDLVAAGLFAPNGQPFNYKQYGVTGTAPANTVTVRSRISMIGGLANPAGGGQAFVVDDFELTGVPEPSGAMLGLMGLAGLLCFRSRKA